jgi:hypothetical protein
MSPEDALYSPIVPADKLRELVKRLLSNPNDTDLIDQISDEIIDLFVRHGVTDEDDIIDAVYRTKRELDGYLLHTPEIGRGYYMVGVAATCP